MTYLEKHSHLVDRQLTVSSGSGDQQVLMCCPRHLEEVRIRYLPDAPSMPVAIAARISLSFPGLISALPLLCIDYSRGPGHRKLITAWCSDGGIASNFPMHFLDAPWPSRPTFGLNLDKEHPDYPTQMVWRPQNTLSGVFHAVTNRPRWSDSRARWSAQCRTGLTPVRSPCRGSATG